MSYKNILGAIADAKRGDMDKVEKVASAMFNDASLNKINEFQLIASQNPQWSARFNKALKLDEKNQVKSYSKEDLKAQFSLMDPGFNKLTKEEQDEKVIKFTATTGSDTSGTNVAVDGVIPTNILQVEDYLFRKDAGILSNFTTINDTKETQMPEFDVDPVAESLAEAGSSTERGINKFDNDDYTLNPNKKFQVHTRVNELALRKGTPEYFALMRAKLVRSVQSLLVNQSFTGNNAGQNLHGMLVTVGSGANTRGSFDVTADLATTTPFEKLVEMLGKLPDDLGEEEMKEYSWVMSRNTFYNTIVPSLDGNQRYYLDAIMSGTPTLVGPGGLPIRLVSKQAVQNDRVILAPLSKYFLQLANQITLLDDGGVTHFVAGQTLIKAFVFADGKYIGNRKRNAGDTADTPDRNYFRFADL